MGQSTRSEVAGKGSWEKVVVGRGGLDGGGEGFYFISTFGAKFLAVKTSFHNNNNHKNCHLKVATTKMMKRKPGESGWGVGVKKDVAKTRNASKRISLHCNGCESGHCLGLE